jgi:hypothetical protein
MRAKPFLKVGPADDKQFSHWLNTCWGMEFGTTFSFGFLVGLGMGFVETTEGGEVYQKGKKFYRRKKGYSEDSVIIFVPGRFTYRF